MNNHLKGLLFPLLFCIGGAHAQGSFSFSKQGKEITFACAWEDSKGKFGFDGKKFDWKHGEFSGVAGQGALGGWQALRANPWYDVGSRAGSPWVDSARFLIVGVKSKNIGFILATEKEGDSQSQGRQGYFGLEASTAKFKTKALAVESSLSIALTESRRNTEASGWSTRLPPQSGDKLLHLGSYANLAFGDLNASFWLSGYKPQFGYFDFASAMGIGLGKKLNAHVFCGFKASAFFCGEGYRNILGEVPSLDRALGLESELRFGSWRVEAGIRSISKGASKDSLENIHLFDPNVSCVSRLGWIWKTDALITKFSALWIKGVLESHFQGKANFDSRGFASAAAEASLVFGKGTNRPTHAAFSLGVTISQNEVEEEEQWSEEFFSQELNQRNRAEMRLRAIKGAISLHWLGFDKIGRGEASFSLGWRTGIVSASFSVSQKVLVSRRAELRFALSSPEAGYAIYPKDIAGELAIPDFRLALALDHWL